MYHRCDRSDANIDIYVIYIFVFIAMFNGINMYGLLACYSKYIFTS